MESLCGNREKELEECRELHSRERGVVVDRLEKAKQLNQSLADEYSRKKSDYKRELALARQ